MLSSTKAWHPAPPADLHFNPGHRSDPPGQNKESHFSATPSRGVFQIFTVRSRLAETSHLPSGLKATLSTQLVWPCSVRISLVALFQTFTVESVLLQASTRSSSGWNATLCTTPVGSGSVSSNCHVSASQTLMVRSQLPETRRRPS